MSPMFGQVTCVSRSAVHAFSKQPVDAINLIENQGVEGDAHCSPTVRHRSRAARDPNQVNLRQVHLIEAELFDELVGDGHLVRPGDLGENITTLGLDLLSLPVDAVLDIGDRAQVRLTGLRNPCVQIDRFQPGLMKKVLTRQGNPGFRRGAMAVVTRSGVVRPADTITVAMPDAPHVALARV